MNKENGLVTKTESIVEVKHLAKSFGSQKVLEDVTFQMQRGEMVGIVGENGSGKSTLLKILAGLLKPTAGEFIIQGSIGFCPQEMLLFENLTIRENFRYFATAYGLTEPKSKGSWIEVKDDLLSRFRFHQYEETLVSHLSGGTKQKLNLSLALLHSPDVFILDEPYSGFDWETYLHFWQYAEELKLQRRSILIVSHFIYDRSKFDTVFELSKGVLKCA